MANANTGLASRDTGNEIVKKSWKEADRLNKAANPDGLEGTWIPWRAVEVDRAILPRTQLDKVAVEDYSDILDALPPIEVQAGTLKLIAGNHRIEAAAMKGISCIRAIIRDIPDADLVDAAFKSNHGHGVPYKRADRRAYAIKKLQQFPDWSNRRLMMEAGVSERTIATLRAAMKEEAKTEEEKDRVAPRQRKGVDDKPRNVSKGRAKAEKVTVSDPPVDPVTEAENRKIRERQAAPAEFVILDRVSEMLDYSAKLLVNNTPNAQLGKLSESLDALRDKAMDWFRDARQQVDLRMAGKSSEPEPEQELAEGEQPEPGTEPVQELSVDPESEIPGTVEETTLPMADMTDEQIEAAFSESPFDEEEPENEPSREPIEAIP